jgi:hypothetical protein
MGQAIPRQQPAVVLRSQFNQLRALLAIALVAVAGLTVAVVILSNDADEASSTSSAQPIESINYGGSKNVNPSTGYPTAPFPHVEHPLQNRIDGTRFDGGPNEGTADVTPAQPRTADVPPGQPHVIQRQGSPALVNQSNEAAGDYAHGPLPPAAPTKDYSKNGATGDYSTEPQAQSGSRADGAPDEGSHLR